MQNGECTAARGSIHCERTAVAGPGADPLAVLSGAAGWLHEPGVPAGGPRVRRTGLATTDLVNARSLLEKHRRAFELTETCESDRPLSIQLYGSVISEMEQAARWVEEKGATAVDINMGCPVRKVVRTGGGSALMCQMDRAVDLVTAVVDAVSIPVTVKMRLGWDDESLTAPDLARAFEQVGVAGRDRARPHSSARVQGKREPRGHPRGGRGRRADSGRRQR